MFEKISKLSIKAYSGCSMSCVYCHQLSEYKYNPQKFTDYKNLESFLLTLPYDDTVDVTVTGGEITLSPESFINVYKMFQRIERKIETHFDMCVVTNGTNMPVIYEWCDKKMLCPYKTAISWDGIYSSSKSRKIKGKYDDEYFQNVIKTLGQSNYNHNICVTIAITPQTLPDLYDSVKFCLENNVYNFGYYFIHEANYDNEELRTLFREQLTKIAQLYLEYANKGEEISYYNWQLIYTRRLMPQNFYICGKLGYNYHIDVNGDIYPCIYFGDHRIYKFGDIQNGIDLNIQNQFEKEYMIKPLCNHRKCGNVQCSECPASNLVHNKSLSKRFENLCRLLPIENEIYDEYYPQIQSIFKKRNLFISRDEYMNTTSMYDNMSDNESIYEHTDSGIESPHYNNVRQWNKIDGENND